jgi:hypothetical protein
MINSDIILNVAQNAEDIYKTTLLRLFKSNFDLKDDKKVAKEARAVLEVSNFDGKEAAFIKKGKITFDFDYSVYGDDNNNKMKEECEYYYDIIFGSGKFEKSLKMLKEDSSNKKAIITINEEPKPKNGKIPCMTCLYPRIINGRLNLACHMRANNCYRLLLVNMHINQAIHREFARKLNLPIGNYYHFVDSLHIYKKDLDEVKKFLRV